MEHESQLVRINQLGYDNSFDDAAEDELRFGKGGVDDAEDAEVILHEYGHAIHFSQNFGFGGEGGAISEGFGDYWAVDGLAISSRRRPTRPCVADWDSVVVHVDGAALPAARRHGPPLPGGPERGGAPRRPDLVARALGHPRGGRPDDGRHGDPPGLVRLPRHDDDRPANRTVAAAQQLYGIGVAAQGQEGVPGPRNPLSLTRQWLDLLETFGEVDRCVSVAWVAGGEVTLDAGGRLNEALRRALVVRAVGGAPNRELDARGGGGRAARRRARRRPARARSCGAGSNGSRRVAGTAGRRGRRSTRCSRTTTSPGAASRRRTWPPSSLEGWQDARMRMRRERGRDRSPAGPRRDRGVGPLHRAAGLQADRERVPDQRPAPGSTEEGRPLLFVKQKKMKIKEDIRFRLDPDGTSTFMIKSKSVFEFRGRHEVLDADSRVIGMLEKDFMDQ